MNFGAFWGVVLLMCVVAIVISFLIPDFIDGMTP
jgi:hypothetical protein